jgi:small-conductance mechanosensitive channel
MPPEQVKECMVNAASTASYVMSNPSPIAILREFGDSAMHYEVKFWVEREELVMDACDCVRTKIWHAARKANLKMPQAVRALRIERSGRSGAPAA